MPYDLSYPNNLALLPTRQGRSVRYVDYLHVAMRLTKH